MGKPDWQLEWLYQMEKQWEIDKELRKEYRKFCDEVDELYDLFVHENYREPEYLVVNIDVIKLFLSWNRRICKLDDFELERAIRQLELGKEVDVKFVYVFYVYGKPITFKFENSDIPIRFE